MVKKYFVLFKAEFFELYWKHKALIWLSLVYILLKAPSLFEPYWYGDEGVTMAVGMAIRRGLLLYRDIYDNKPPLLYLIASITNDNLFFFKLFSLFLGIGGLWFFFQLSRYIFSVKKPIIVVCCLLFVVLTTTPIFEGNIVNGEIVFLVFSLAGYYFALVKNRYPIAGLFFSLAFLTKVPAFFDLVPLIVWMLAQLKHKSSPIKVKQLMRLVGAFVLPILLSMIFFVVRGGINEYLQSAFLQMVGYVSSWGPNSQSLGLAGLIKNQLVLKAILLLSLTIICLLRWSKSKKIPLVEMFALWLICSLFGATMSGRPYPHYLLQTVAPLCLGIGYLLVVKRRELVLTVISLAIFGFAYFNCHFWQYPTWSYYKNFVNLMRNGQSGKDSYYRFFDSALPEIYQMASFMSAYTNQDDRIFVWSDYAQFYPMSRRLPAFRTTTAYHVTEKMVKSGLFSTEAPTLPKAIVVDRRIKPNAELTLLVERNYRLAEKSTNFDLFIIKQDQQ